MLALTRKAKESIVVNVGGQSMTVFFTRVRGGKVRLAFQASAEFKILRGELVDAPPSSPNPQRKAA